jgi:hypothetical protein
LAPELRSLGGEGMGVTAHATNGELNPSSFSPLRYAGATGGTHPFQPPRAPFETAWITVAIGPPLLAERLSTVHFRLEHTDVRIRKLGPR